MGFINYFVAILVLVYGGLNSIQGLEKLSETNAYVPIGSYGLKTYFTDNRNYTSFEKAANYCQSVLRSELLVIDDEVEFEYLKQTLNMSQFNSTRFWTSGISSRDFKWKDGNGSVVDEMVFPITDFHGVCIIFLTPELRSEYCGERDLNVEYYPLCQNLNPGN